MVKDDLKALRHPDARSLRERHPGQWRHRRLDQCGHPFAAIAGRVGIDLTLEDWDRLGRDVPTLVNLMPSGKYLMEEFFYAGGLPVVQRMLGEAGLLHKQALTVSGQGGLERTSKAPATGTRTSSARSTRR